MIDRDFAFLRLRTSLADAINLNESRGVELEYVGNIHLIPGETYLQLSNSPTDITFSSNYEVYLVDHCGNEVQDVTENIFIEEFYNLNGVKQIAWEFVNQFEYYYKPLSLRFKNTINDDTWYTNLFISTAEDSNFTTRFDYSMTGGTIHNGTYYPKLTYTQSIRLGCWYDDDVNQSERSEYHQITTDITMSSRNIRKIKEKYLLEEFSTFHTRRLETLLTSEFVYVDNVRSFSSDAVEFPEREGNSNIGYGEFLISKDYSQIFTFDYQIFDGIQVVNFDPKGMYVTGTTFTKYRITYNGDITLNTGTVLLYNDSNTLIETFTEADMSVTGAFLDIDVVGSNGASPSDDTYYLHVSAGLVTLLTDDSDEIADSTTWTFTLLAAQYDSTDYTSTDYLTN